MSSRAPGIPMEGMIPIDKLAAPATHSTTGLRSYIPALDGVRGLAILLVLAHNLNPFGSGGHVEQAVELATNFGWAGVQLFFVLSGFLITGILLDTRGAPHVHTYVNISKKS